MPYLKYTIIFNVTCISKIHGYVWCNILNAALCLIPHVKYPVMFDAISPIPSYA